MTGPDIGDEDADTPPQPVDDPDRPAGEPDDERRRGYEPL